MNKELLTKFRHKKEAYKRWKQRQVTPREHGDTLQAHEGAFR